MKQGLLCAFLIVSLHVVACPFAGAESLQDEYARLTMRRSNLESRAEKLRQDLRTLETRTLRLQESWLDCVNERWRFVWKSHVITADESRKDLETQRIRLFTLNKNLKTRNFELEQRRRKIEHDFLTKGFEYEETFRAFMHSLENEYLFILENEYFYGFERYLSGISSYHSFIEHAKRACDTNDVTPVATEQGLRYVKEIMDVIKSIRELFKGA